MYNKSMFVQQTNTSRFLYQPVGILKTSGSSGNCTDASGCFQLPQYAQDTLQSVQSLYTSRMANATYASIPGANLTQYFELYEMMEHYLNNSQCSDINLLFRIAEEGLQGSLNSYNINYINTTLRLQNSQLQKNINDILAGINQVNALSNVSGQFILNKSFKIAPLFSYYIMVYGFPAQGVGFDQNKLSMLLEILEDNDIDPYN